MAKKSTPNYKEGQAALAAMMSEPIVPTLQRVVPVEQPPVVAPVAEAGTAPAKPAKAVLHEGETHVNYWIDTTLYNQMRQRVFENKGLTMKDIVNEALRAYLKDNR